jgi:hypothetical protein
VGYFNAAGTELALREFAQELSFPQVGSASLEITTLLEINARRESRQPGGPADREQGGS